MPLGPILLTGVQGFCASRLHAFLKETYEVRGLSRQQLDITDRDACLRLIKEIRPRIVLHSAAISRMDVCESDPALSYAVNVLGPQHLAEACAATGARLIHFSTDQVYNGTAEPAPHKETAPLQPKNVYGRHKKEAEARIAAITGNYAALRLTWMYGFPARGMPTSRNLLTLCQQALYTNTPLTLPSHTGRGITHVWEVIQNIPALFHAPCGIYNFGSFSETSTWDAARHIFSLLGAQSRIEELLRPENEAAGKYADLRMDCGKAAALGMRFPSTEEGIEKAFREYQMI